jgi:ACS family tartrate transporter-like MFS transporter
MITWGTISVAMMFVRTPTHFYILRFLLGAAEAGFFPGVIYYLSLWYPETERARAIARFMTAVPVSGLIGGPLSGLLLKLNGTFGLGGWQWLFLVEGLPAIILGVVVLFYLPDHPENAHWLTRAERDALGGSQSDRLTRPSGGSPDGSYAERDTRRPSEAGSFTSETSILRALTSSVIWQLGIIFLLAAMAFYGYSFWAPLVIKSLTGVSDLGVGLIAGAISAATIVFMLANGAHSDRTDEQPIHTAVALAMMALGCVGCAIFQAPVLGILSLALIPIGHCSAYGPFWSMPSRFLTGRAAAAGTALVVTIANVGGFLGPSLMGYLKQRSGTHTLAFLLLAAFGIMAALLAYALRRSPALAPK